MKATIQPILASRKKNKLNQRNYYYSVRTMHLLFIGGGHFANQGTFSSCICRNGKDSKACHCSKVKLAGFVGTFAFSTTHTRNRPGRSSTRKQELGGFVPRNGFKFHFGTARSSTTRTVHPIGHVFAAQIKTKFFASAVSNAFLVAGAVSGSMMVVIVVIVSLLVKPCLFQSLAYFCCCSLC